MSNSEYSVIKSDVIKSFDCNASKTMQHITWAGSILRWILTDPLALLQTKQTQIRQLLLKLPDQGLLLFAYGNWYIRSYTSGPDK